MGQEHDKQICEVKDLVSALGGHVYATNQVGKNRGDAGIPDLIVFLPEGYRARMLYLEVKVGRDKLRPAQIGFKVLSEEAGIPVVVGRVGDLADFLGL